MYQRLFDVTVDDQKGGIVDGAHTAKIIEQSNEEGTAPQEQYVEVYTRTGIEDDVIANNARGLNTAIQVAPKSIYNIDGVFDWQKTRCLHRVTTGCLRGRNPMPPRTMCGI